MRDALVVAVISTLVFAVSLVAWNHYHLPYQNWWIAIWFVCTALVAGGMAGGEIAHEKINAAIKKHAVMLSQQQAELAASEERHRSTSAGAGAGSGDHKS